MMGSNEPKISFGVKAKPKTLLGISPASSVTLKAKEAKERIEFLEGNLIKTSGKQEEQRSTFLVIPPLKNERSTERTAKVSIIQQLKQQRLQDGATLSSTNSMLNDGIETLEQRAAREIVAETADAIIKKEDSSSIVVPLRPEELPLDGARESTLDDYESVPIEQFGQGMLRGMGWKGDVKKETEKLTMGPAPRPKGLGLGADRSVKQGNGQGTVPLAQGEGLVMKSGAPVKIISGRHKGKYATKGAPEQVILLDWQSARYSSPILDLAYFILCCTDEEFRRRHYDEMMNVYYNSLATLLEKLGHSPQQIFPRTAFLRQLRQYGRFGLMLASFVVPMLCTRSEDLLDMDATAEMFRETQNVDIAIYTKNTDQSAYRKRMSAVIRDTVRYGYI